MRILTWNMQGYGGIADKSSILSQFLNGEKYDVICVQEEGEIL